MEKVLSLVPFLKPHYEFVTYTSGIYYFIILTFGFLWNYMTNDDTFYYTTRMSFPRPYSIRFALVKPCVSLAARFINAATISIIVEVFQQMHFVWLILVMSIPISQIILMILVKVLICLNNCESFEDILVGSAGPLSIVFYFIITVAHTYIFAASFTAIAEFMKGINLMGNLEAKFAICIITLSYCMINGFNLMSYIDIIAFFVFICVLFLILIIMLAKIDQSLPDRIQILMPSDPFRNHVYFIDCYAAMLFGCFIDPSYFNLLNDTLDLYPNFTLRIIFPFSLILVLVVQVFVFASCYLSSMVVNSTSTSSIISQIPLSLPQIYQLNLSHEAARLLLYSALLAAMLASHNTLLLHLVYWVCDLMPKMLRKLPYQSRSFRQIFRLVICLVMVGAAVSISFYFENNIFIIFFTGIDLLYVFIFPQFIVSTALEIANCFGALASLIVSIVLRYTLLSPTMSHIQLFSSANSSEKIIANDYRFSITSIIPIRSIIVVISILINLAVSYIAVKTGVLFTFNERFENYILPEYITDNESATVDESTASIKIKWNLTKIENNLVLKPFDLNKLHEVDRFYKDIPEDFLYNTKLIKSLKKSLKTKTELSVFKTPLQHRINKKDLLCDEKRLYCHLTKLHREWVFYVMALRPKTNTSRRLSSISISRSMIEFVAYQLMGEESSEPSSTNPIVDLSTLIEENQLRSSKIQTPSIVSNYSMKQVVEPNNSTNTFVQKKLERITNHRRTSIIKGSSSDISNYSMKQIVEPNKSVDFDRISTSTIQEFDDL